MGFSMERTDGTVYVVDDDPAIRTAMSRLLEEVQLPVREFADAQSFLDEFTGSEICCIILDIRMPGMSGIELQKKLVADGHDSPVIIVSGHGDIPMAVDAVQRGAFDFLEKPFSVQTLLDRIQQALAHHRLVRARDGRRRDLEVRYQKLTPRECEVIDHVITGKTNKQIAFELGVSSQAIDARRANAMRKLSCDNIPQVTEFMLRLRNSVTQREERSSPS